MGGAKNHDVITPKGGKPIKMWTRGVPVEEGALRQLQQTAQLPFIHKWVAVMPDVHQGMGATIGSVVPTVGAIIPAAVGVDIGCGMMAVRTDLSAKDLPDSLKALRNAIERAVPHGRQIGRKKRDTGAWGDPPDDVLAGWKRLEKGFHTIIDRHPRLARTNHVNHLGTLGTGNHFIEACLDEGDRLWFMLHSGSRGVGNAIGRTHIQRAKQEMRRRRINLPDEDLAYFSDGSTHFVDYVFAVEWAQRFAAINREIMMKRVLDAARSSLGVTIGIDGEVVDCHHNHVAREKHFGKNVFVTRKGAVRARAGEMGIIPGSMGARSYIVRGLGNADSFHSCSHGAGRVMSRTEARRRISLKDHLAATRGIECRTDAALLDESPAAYKSIDAVMAAQRDLVAIVHTLRQVVCVKG